MAATDRVPRQVRMGPQILQYSSMLTIQPASLTLNDSRDARSVIVTGRTLAGYSVDLSPIAKAQPAPVKSRPTASDSAPPPGPTNDNDKFPRPPYRPPTREDDATVMVIMIEVAAVAGILSRRQGRKSPATKSEKAAHKQ